MHPVRIAFGLAFDVEKALDRKSNFKPADTVFKTGAKQFAELRLHGFAAALECGFASKLLVVGGTESRYGKEQISRAVAIRDMLVDDHGVAPDRVEALASEPHTIGNAQAIKAALDEQGLAAHECALITSAYHLHRVHLDLLGVGLSLPLFPAEAFWLLKGATKEERAGRRANLVADFGHGPLAERLADELNGVAAKLEGTYQA
jgi:hypothetical protein